MLSFMNTRKTSDIFAFGTKILAVVGLLALIIVGSFLTLTLASYAAPYAMRGINIASVYLSSAFTPSEKISIDAPSEITSGKAFTLSFNHADKKADGSYTLNIPCVDGVSITASTSLSEKETVYCNVPFHFVNENNSVSLTAVSKKNRFVDFSTTIAFTPNGKNTVSVSGSKISILTNPGIALSNNYIDIKTPAAGTNNKPIGTTPGTKKEESYTTGPFGSTTGTTVSNPTGKPDLRATLIAVGYVTGATNEFVASSTLHRSDKIAVKFYVENIGTKVSPEWRFNGILPTFPYHVFNSDAQQPIAPGDRIEYTIAFDRSMEGQQEVKIVLDPSLYITELDENNNTLIVPMKIL